MYEFYSSLVVETSFELEGQYECNRLGSIRAWWDGDSSVCVVVVMVVVRD